MKNLLMHKGSSMPSSMSKGNESEGQYQLAQTLLGMSRQLSSSNNHSRPAPPAMGSHDIPRNLNPRDYQKSLISKRPLIPKTRKHEAKFQCLKPKCSQRFTRAANLQAHVRAHDNERPFLCAECGKTFTRPEDLSRHFKEQHTGTSKQHVCGVLGFPGPEGCGQSFTRAEALRRHLRSKVGSRCRRPTGGEIPVGKRRNIGDECIGSGDEDST